MAVRTVRKSEIAAMLGAAWNGDDTELRRVCRIEDAGPDAIVFATDDKLLKAALDSDAGLILTRAAEQPRVISVLDPRSAFARVYARWFDLRGLSGIHETAWIDPAAKIGEGCEIGAGAFIGSSVTLGDGCVIGPRAVILAGTVLGNRVRVQAGAVLGSDGFGFARGLDGYIAFPQIGTLWIGDDVEIGANTTIDRGALGETRIGRGTKIDNLVHIGHNCVIGEHVIMAAQVGIAGSTQVGEGAILGGQVGLAEHVEIGPGVIVGAQGGVPTGKKLRAKGDDFTFWGTPARPIREYLKDLAALARLRGRQ
jgi:UDP-3-O-[3-hydroxymyristoyl] glucosamine N-acyltransferase